MEHLTKILSEYKQEHLVRFFNDLTEGEKQQLAQQLETLDFAHVTEIFKNNVANREEAINTLEPLPFKAIAATTKEDIEQWFSASRDAFAKGEVAAFLVAGGQGSRLGFDGPKGAFDMGLPSGKSLFQLQAERLLNLSKNYGNSIPWYIMTSELNNEATINHFKKYDFFGYPQKDIHFFNQGMIPAFNADGSILLQSKSELALVPDGNGGCFAALERSGMLDNMKQRGVKHIFLYGVDNALVEVCDPEYVGYYLTEGKEASAKVVKKAYPDEKVGLFALKNGKPGVLEYSDIDDETRQKTDTAGNLVYDGGNIAVHMITVAAVERLQERPLPYHTAFKKVSSIDASGALIKPETENAYKFEQFMFDIFGDVGELSLFEVDRASEFAPIKNATGNDSPETARTLVLELHTQWLKDAGLAIDSDCYYEISPLISSYGENLNQQTFDQGLESGLIFSVNR
ncbi:MAG: UDPGP type 1 family protein [Fibrobacterales bacterium]